MKFSRTWAVWLWALQAVTGLLLVVYIVIHTIDNATILVSTQAYEDMLEIWHGWLPGWFYLLLVIGLVGVFLIHTMNGIRIASRPYRDFDISWKQNVMLMHTGTSLWYAQVVSGSAIAIFGIWHLIVQHGTESTTTALQSMMRVSPTVYIIYLLFLLAVTFHAFNGVRAIIIKFGIMTDKAKEGVLVSVMALLFIVFFVVGAASMAKFIPGPSEVAVEEEAEMHSTAVLEESNTRRPASDLPGLMSGGE
jgi:succinate dehydrogenase/fumarate reductase cytochrome b subunit